MANTRSGRYVTAEEFLRLPNASDPGELVRGEVRMVTPAGGVHGIVASAIHVALTLFVDANGLGVCFGDNVGFLLPGLGDTVRSPHAAFVRAEQLRPGGLGQGWVPVAPDLVVEVLSPNETASELEAKLRDYRAAGTRLFWVIDPETRTVTVRGNASPDAWLTDRDMLDGGDVVPGFSLPVAKLFARLAR